MVLLVIVTLPAKLVYAATLIADIARDGAVCDGDGGRNSYLRHHPCCCLRWCCFDREVPPINTPPPVLPEMVLF